MFRKEKKIPSSAGHNNKAKTPKVHENNYSIMYPAWRIGHFDKEGPWGLSNLTTFKFNYTDEIYENVYKVQDDDLDKALTSLQGKEFANYSQFLEKFSQSYDKSLPLNVQKAIYNSLIATFFELIFPKLKEFENMTWGQIDRQTHGKDGKSSNHNDKIEDLGIKARKRLSELGYTDYTEIYSLRLGGLERIFGFREKNYLDIIWVDLYHSVYPSHRK